MCVAWAWPERGGKAGRECILADCVSGLRDAGETSEAGESVGQNLVSERGQRGGEPTEDL